MFYGVYEDVIAIFHWHYLVITDMRLIIWKRAAFDESIMIFPYNKISELDIYLGLGSATLRFKYY